MKRTLDRTDYLDNAELGRLLAAARGRQHVNARRDHALLALLANTGIRPGEAVRLTVADFRLTDHEPQLRVRRLKTRREGGRIDDLALSRALARTLRVYFRTAGLSYNPENIRADLDACPFPLSVRSVENVFRYYARRAGLEVGYRLYALRHTALSRAYQATGDIRLVQELAGHASVTTTQIYTHVSPAQKRAVAERVGSIV